MATKKVATYTASNIKTLVFPESVRMNASQYIGGTDAYGLWMIVKELLDNGLDEALAGRNDKIQLFIDSDKSYWVIDNGHGVPQGVTKTKIHVNGKDVVNKMPTMQAVFGALNTSGKYDSSAYEVSIGTHGIGSKGTNATCDYFTVWTFFEGKWYTIAFKKGVLVHPPKSCSAPKLPTGKTAKSGTVIHCKPDMSIFSSDVFPVKSAIDWAEIMAYFNPGVEIRITSKKSERVFLSKKGVSEYIEKRLSELKAEGEKQIFEYKSVIGDPNAADVMISFSTYHECDLKGYTNGSHNSKGGKHVDSVTAALYAGIRPFIKTKKVDGKLQPLFREGDLKEGLVGIVNAKLHKAKFNSQDKVFLSDERMGKDFQDKVTKAATAFFKANKALAGRLCEKATRINELKANFTLSKKAAANLNKVKRTGLPAKYAGYDRKTKIEDRELFLVEGDSAAGKLKEARFPWQAVLPLKGKILNVLKDKKQKAMESEEVINILAAIGYDPKAVDPLKKLQVGKIICTADPDPDGPFVGETGIRIRFPDAKTPNPEVIYNLAGTEDVRQIMQLADWTKQGIKFEVPVYTGTKTVWTPATAELVRNVDKLVGLEVGKHKYRVSVDHKFKIVRTKATRDRELAVDENNPKLAWIEAGEMKIGDRLHCPEFDFMERHDWDRQDKASGMGFLAVTKLRVQEQKTPVPVYCLNVPRFHQFTLPSGIVSANCHINSLLLTLFYKYLPQLFEQGMVYVSDIPEFYSIAKGKLIQGDTVSEVQKKLKKEGAPASTAVNHIKGWGEVNKNLLRIMACDAATRRLIKITAIENEDHVDFAKLMNDDVEYRRKMLGLPDNAVGEEVDDEREPAARRTARKTPAVKKAPAAKKAPVVKKVAAKKTPAATKAKAQVAKKVVDDEETDEERSQRKAFRRNFVARGNRALGL